MISAMLGRKTVSASMELLWMYLESDLNQILQGRNGVDAAVVDLGSRSERWPWVTKHGIVTCPRSRTNKTGSVRVMDLLYASPKANANSSPDVQAEISRLGPYAFPVKPVEQVAVLSRSSV